MEMRVGRGSRNYGTGRCLLSKLRLDSREITVNRGIGTSMISYREVINGCQEETALQRVEVSQKPYQKDHIRSHAFPHRPVTCDRVTLCLLQILQLSFET